jgi:hypothetical protein
VNSDDQTRPKPNWIAWAITLGEGFVVLVFGIILSQYWLMLPVWMRSGAGLFLGLAFLVVGFRFFKFRRNQNR